MPRQGQDQEAQGRLRCHLPGLRVKGGKESGAGITWGDASKSSLFKTAELGISSPDDDLAMPPKKAKERHPLTKEQLEKVKAFIESNK